MLAERTKDGSIHIPRLDAVPYYVHGALQVLLNLRPRRCASSRRSRAADSTAKKTIRR